MTDAEIDSACLSYRHDFGLLSKPEKDRVRFECREWVHAISKARQSPKVRKLVWDDLGDKWNTVTSGRIQISQHGACPLWSLTCASVEANGTFDTLGEAKAAAQAAYEARILGALE